MQWNKRHPPRTAVFHRGGRVQTVGNGFGNYGTLILFKRINLRLNIRFQSVNLPALSIQKLRNSLLLSKWRETNLLI